MRAFTAAVLMLFFTPAIFPQNKIVEIIEVRVVNVDVVVRDRAGNPVYGLTKDDFELYEDRTRQPITNLYEVRRDPSDATKAADADSVPLELRQRRILLFFDSGSVEPSRKNAVLNAVDKFVDQKMRPEDQAMVVSWRLGLQIISPFSSDKATVKRAVEKLRHIAPGGDAQARIVGQLKRDIEYYVRVAKEGIVPFPEAHTKALSLIDRYSQSLMVEEEPMLAALEQMSSNLGGLQGKKVILLVSENLSERPAAELYRYVETQFSQNMPGLPPDLQMLVGGSGNKIPALVDDAAHRAAENGVMIYAIGTGQAEGEFSSETNESVDTVEAFSRVANTGSALQAMAGMTGGVAITHTTNFDLALDTISRDLDSYYSLGYKPVEAGSTPRRIVVKTRNPAYRVRFRGSVVLKTTDDQMSDRVIANLFADGGSGEWPITIRTGAPARDGGHFRIPVQVVMPATITLLPQDDKLVGGFVLYFVVGGGGSGKASDVMRRPQGLGIPPAAEQAIRAKPMTFTTAINVNPGESVLSVGIVDQLSGATGFARTKISAR